MNASKTAAVAALSLFAIAGPSNAAVVGLSPNADLGAGAFTFDLGAASYTFSDSGETGGFFGTPIPAVQTGGTATVASLGAPFNTELQPTTYFTDETRAPFIDEDLLATFASYDAPATIDAQVDSFVALRFALEDGDHFGFARLAGLTLFDIAYETEAGVGIQAGPGPFAAPPVAAVPLPATLPLLGAAAAALFGLSRRRRAA